MDRKGLTEVTWIDIFTTVFLVISLTTVMKKKETKCLLLVTSLTTAIRRKETNHPFIVTSLRTATRKKETKCPLKPVFIQFF